MDYRPPVGGEVERLLLLLVEGELASADQQRLGELLESDSAVRAYYVRYIALHADLQNKHAHPPIVLPPPGSTALPLFDPLPGATADDAPLPPSLGPAFLPGFLSDLGQRSWDFFSHHTLWLALLAMVALGSVIGIASLALYGSRETEVAERMKGGDTALPAGLSQQEFQTPAVVSESKPVARLTRVVGCRWRGTAATLNPGDRLTTGQSLYLLSGVAEITFDVGAKVILQSPADFAIESGTSAWMDAGKATVEIKTVAARGFQIRTPEATFIDRGTEFGLEVSPGGSSRVHVFQGEVQVKRPLKGGAAPLSQRLLTNCGALLEGDLRLFEDTGECFIRSVDDADRDRQVVAFWRFEDQPVGAVVPDTELNRNPVRGTMDSSFNGNDMFTYCWQTRPRFSGQVPEAVVPRNGRPNRACLDNTQPLIHDTPTRDLYSNSKFSHAAPLDIQKISPAQWTIEASIKPARLRQGVQTFVGRDAYDFTSGSHVPPRLAFQITERDRFAIRFADAEGRTHEAIAAEMPVQTDHWYHTAAVSDGRTLKLYVDSRGGHGYQLQATTALPATGSTALAKLDDQAEWSIGRGRKDSKPAEWFQGWIDEVRISVAALTPDEFLFSPN